MAAGPPGLDGTFSQVFFQLSQATSYDFGPTSRLLNETNRGFNTGSMRNVFSPDVVCARELMVDRLAQEWDRDPYEFRRDFLSDERSRAVLDKVAEVGEWGRSMPADTAQGIAFQAEYKAVCATVVEIDCRRTARRSSPGTWRSHGPGPSGSVGSARSGTPARPTRPRRRRVRPCPPTAYRLERGGSTPKASQNRVVNMACPHSPYVLPMMSRWISLVPP